MEAQFDTTASSLQAIQRQYEAIAHNLANVSTAGFKRNHTVFSQMLAARLGDAQAGAPEADGAARVVGTTVIDFSQAHLVPTGRKLDVALEGGGFFVVETPAGPMYTRNGAFRVNAERQVVDSAGRSVAGEGGQITLPPAVSSEDLRIGTDGQVLAAGKSIGQLRVVEFKDVSVLRPAGESCFQAPEGVAGEPPANTLVRQGFQEASNVNMVEELVGLITVSKLYEANIKSIRTEDERMKTILQVAMG